MVHPNVRGLDGEMIPLLGYTIVKLYDLIDWMNIIHDNIDKKEKKNPADCLTPKAEKISWCSHKEREFNKKIGRVIATARAMKEVGLHV